jgi:hypothetical protein
MLDSFYQQMVAKGKTNRPIVREAGDSSLVQGRL